MIHSTGLALLLLYLLIPSSARGQPATPPDESAPAFRLPPGFEIRLVASEPVLSNPMTMALDEEGRVYVSLAHSYRYGAEGSPVQPPSNPIVRLELGPGGDLLRHSAVASGFANPIMGIAVKGRKIWLTNLDRLLVADLDEGGRAGEFHAVVRDAESPWNPFGMYRAAFGPDGLLYLSVGDHATRLTGPTNTVAVRGNTGAVFRMEPDGSKIEIFLQGMRAPFSFDFTPFGDLWVLSNGEGNPNRLIHAIRGADYHFQTRPVDWAWLAGKHPLAPPVHENPPGAHTAVVVCSTLDFPESFTGNLLVSNWGCHGFPSANHVVLRHRLGEQGEVAASEPFLETSDPRFRPTQLLPAPDGGLYVLDWYGQDDENDLTGRLYKISYRGNEPRIARAGVTRAAAAQVWELRRGSEAGRTEALARFLEHPDARLRRLAVRLLHDLGAHPPQLAARARSDPDIDVRVEAAASLEEPGEKVRSLLGALRSGGARIPRLRYLAALEIARSGREADFRALASDDAEDVRVAGLTVIDAAFHEEARSGDARAALLALVARPGRLPILEVLSLAGRWRHKGMLEAANGALEKYLANAAADITILDAPGAKASVLEVLASRRPSPGTLKILARLARDTDPGLRSAAHGVLASTGHADAGSIALSRELAGNDSEPLEARLDAIVTLSRIEGSFDPTLWRKLLANPSRDVALVALRALRAYAGQPAAAQALRDAAPAFAAREEPFAPDAAFLGPLIAATPPAGEPKEALRERTLERCRTGSPLLGRLAFRMLACHSCHAAGGRETPFGPSLDGVASTNPPEYLIDSILYPSKVIKTGFECEAVVTRAGEVFTGKVTREGDRLMIAASPEKQAIVPVSEVEKREKQNVSIMPESLEQTMSGAELADLIAYLATLKSPQASSTSTNTPSKGAQP